MSTPSAARTVVRVTLGGERFASHAVPVESLRELAAFQALVQEVGRWLFYREHPGAGRLPNNFDESFGLACRTIREGSAVLPMEPSARPIGFDELEAGNFGSAGYLERSILVVIATANAANSGGPLPVEFPRTATEKVEAFGATLRADEWFGIEAARPDPVSCRYTTTTRETLLTYTWQSYDDQIDVTGPVVAADVRRGQFIISVDGKTTISAPLGSENEDIVLTALRNHAAHRLHILGRGTFEGDGTLKRIAQIRELEVVAAEPGPAPPTAVPIWEVLYRMGDDMPAEESAKLPTDLAQNLDHYLYGAPKRE